MINGTNTTKVQENRVHLWIWLKTLWASQCWLVGWLELHNGSEKRWLSEKMWRWWRQMKEICFQHPLSPLLLWAEKTREQNTCKSDLNRIMTERPNICYIFEKLSVQGCQIWHSHVSMPFNSAPAHSTRPHNAKKALYVIISAEIPENLVHKSYCLKH